jgi:hypothetical protein
MDIKDLEERVNERGTKSYWKDGVKLAKECTRCKEVKSMEEFHSKKGKSDGKNSCCKKCAAEKQRESSRYKEYQKRYREENKERLSQQHKEYAKKNNEKIKEYRKEYRIKNRERLLEKEKLYRETHPNYMKEWHKNHKEHNRQYYLDNLEHRKQYNLENREKQLAYFKQRYIDKREENIKEIAEMLKEIKSIITEYNLPIYGIIYRFQNIKTGRCYVGQTIRPLKERYCGGITKGWLRERNEHENQQFKEELTNEEDFILTEVLDVGICKWHLDKIESYYIDKYNAFEDGYNNMPGNYYTTDGLEEFKQILNTYNLEFKDNKIIKKD